MDVFGVVDDNPAAADSESGQRPEPADIVGEILGMQKRKDAEKNPERQKDQQKENPKKEGPHDDKR